MFSLKTVHCVAFLYLFVVLCQMCSTSDVKVNNENQKESLEATLDSLFLDVSEESIINHVEFVTKSTNIIKRKDEDVQKDTNFFFKYLLREGFKHNEKLRSVDVPVSQKRVTRQAYPGYSSVYPTLPTKSAYGSFEPYSYNNGASLYPYGQSTNVTTPYNYQNSSRPNNFNWASGQNLYHNHNPQNSRPNGTNYYYPQATTNNLPGGNNNGMFAYNRPGNASLNPYFPQPTSRPFYPGPTSNRRNSSYPQPSGRPLYPGGSTNGSVPAYLQPNGTPFYPGLTSNLTNPSYPQPSGRPLYPGGPTNGSISVYPQPTSRPFYPGVKNNGTIPYYLQTTKRPFYPGAQNVTSPSYHPSTGKPFYPGTTNTGMNPQSGGKPFYPGGNNNSMNQNHSYPPSTGKPYYPGATNNRNPVYPYSSLPSNSNYTNPTFGHAYSNITRPYNSLPNAPPYNSQAGYPPYNPSYSLSNSSSINGPMPGSQGPSYNNNNPYNTWGNSQGFGQNAMNQNVPNPPYGTNPQPNQYNSGDYKFYYPPPYNGSNTHYDPRKNPPEHFSYFR